MLKNSTGAISFLLLLACGDPETNNTSNEIIIQSSQWEEIWTEEFDG